MNWKDQLIEISKKDLGHWGVFPITGKTIDSLGEQWVCRTLQINSVVKEGDTIEEAVQAAYDEVVGPKYPMLVEGRLTGTILYATTDNGKQFTGTVLWEGDGLEVVGYSSHTWRKENFTPYKPDSDTVLTELFDALFQLLRDTELESREQS